MNRFVRGDGAPAGHAPEVQTAGGRWRGVCGWALLLGAALLGSCGGKMGDGAVLGGETHFLVTCGQGCGTGLSCIDGACTRSCEPGYSSCSELSSLASCVSPSDDGGPRTAFGGTCDVLCVADADCALLGTGYSCRSGACRAEPEARQEAISASRSQSLVSAVEADTCQAGLRWVGEESPSAEMRPGSDCLGCHDGASARKLLVGGTVYASGGAGKSQPLDDCFGLEGIEVLVTDADGGEHSTVTNRAGNFYFEGREAEFPLPYAASIHWRLDGVESRTPMFTNAYYGGCARCHDNLSLEEHNRIREEQGQLPTAPPFDTDEVELVLPALTVIYPPDLHPQ